nr:class I SAM-dependent methyltransferase [Solirubrobacterales bacterium]
VVTTVADVSPDMLAQWRAKANELGIAADTFEGDIDDFLLRDEREWDLIVFSSALHHLDDYIEVVGLAAERLAPGGVIVTVLDPTRTGEAITPRLRRFDYLLSLALHPHAFLAALGRRTRRRDEGGVNVGDIAEKHVLEGVDDAAVIRRLEQSGLEVVEHRRYVDQRYRLTEWLMRLMKLSTTFHLIARKRQASPPTSTVSE